ncbi:MAG: hypothetical protein KJ770_05580 [Actinobacteria bacterium]|nr:hypothetical protein [Actinomycetota bacterium]MCG2789354.1 hypothetical protein [Actinomycetes bacterium]
MARRVYIREIYFYLICLIALIIFIVSLVTILDSAINYAKPTTYMTKSGMLMPYQQQYTSLSDAEINKMIDEEIATSVGIERIMALKGLLRGILLIIIAIPLFIFHWKKAQGLWHLNLNNQE